MALSDKQEIFCRKYLIDSNATQSAIWAGYSAKTANRNAFENMSKPDIQSRISKLKSECIDRIDIDANYVLTRLFEIDHMDVLDILKSTDELKPVAQWPKILLTRLSGLAAQPERLSPPWRQRGDVAPSKSSGVSR